MPSGVYKRGEAQRDKNRIKMIKQWKNPIYRKKILNSLHSFSARNKMAQTLRKKKIKPPSRLGTRLPFTITPLNQLIRTSFKYRLWRSDVFTRDNFVCQKCVKKGAGDLNVHHLKPISKILAEYKIKTYDEALNCEELWNVNNGITLCWECHCILHPKLKNLI